MGSEGTSTFEVRNPKSRKRTKKKDKSKEHNIDSQENDSKESEILNEETTSHRKRRGRKQKQNNKLNGTKDKVSQSVERKRNLINIEQNQNKGESEDDEVPAKIARINATYADKDKDEIEKDNRNGKNVPKEPSKRQLKKEKAEKRETEKREAGRIEAVKKALNYVSKWKHAPGEWKFEKLRQICLIDNLLDENSIPDDIFPTVLEYFEGCKGMAREQLLKKGMDVIKKVEEAEENREEMLESVAYKRARMLLQALPTET